jgi:hypothetical protein
MGIIPSPAASIRIRRASLLNAKENSMPQPQLIFVPEALKLENSRAVFRTFTDSPTLLHETFLHFNIQLGAKLVSCLPKLF